MGSGAFLVETCRQLGDELIKAWHVHNQVPKLPPDEDEVLHARRVIAQRWLYGVDKNPMAVDLAKLSLWLATLAKDHPFTFLDHALRPGDSLVGLTQEQIAGFHWAPKKQRDLFRKQIEDKMKHVTKFRQEILAARDDVFYEYLRSRLEHADEQLALARLAGNVVISAYFFGDNDRKRQARLDELEVKMAAYLSPQGKMEDRQPLAQAEATLLGGERPIQPFHWWIEFPEVFLRDSGGFDAIVGNPPFMGGTKISSAYGDAYRDWLLSTHSGAHGNADLVAHFFRRAYNLLRSSGAFGLIATNTIAQGDTRSTGLRWICTAGGTIYAAKRRMKWPGQAAVVVSVVHVWNGRLVGPYRLDWTDRDPGKKVPLISAYLFHVGGNENPATLKANSNKSFLRSKIYGQGFIFDDSAADGLTSPIAEMNRLVAKDRRNAVIIFPYIGGEEVNDSPTHAHHRYVINFGEMTEDEARQWPELLKLVEERVKPERMKLADNSSSIPRKRKWWLWGRYTPGLFSAIRELPQVLVQSHVSPHLELAFLPGSWVYSHKLVVFPLPTLASFSVLQSRVHDRWAWFFSSTMKDDLNYSPSDCFETFPFPMGYDTLVQLESIGREYYDFRAALMVRNNEGLTKTYNRFHDPSEMSPDIIKLRELHAAMDQAVIDAYGWTDLKPTCEFLLDYEDEEDDVGVQPLGCSGQAEAWTPTRRKKPWRYRWPDDLRDEVLARLLALNQDRAQQEALAGKAAEAKTKPATRKRSPRKGKASDDDRPLLK